MFKFSFFWSDCGLISVHHLNMEDEGDTGWVLHLFPSPSFWGFGRFEYTVEGNSVLDIPCGFLFRFVRVK